MGKGIVGFCIKNTGTSTLLVFDSNTDKVFSISNVWPKICIIVAENGNIRYGRHHVHMKFVWLTVEGNVTKLHEEGV